MQRLRGPRCDRRTNLWPLLLVGFVLLLGLRERLRGLDLVFGPCPQLFDELESRRPVENWRFFSLVAKLDRLGREHVRLGERIWFTDVVLLKSSR